MKIDKENFRKMFPHLTKEIESGENNLTAKSAKSEKEIDKSHQFEGYNPDIIDFLCRCDNQQQANEIIVYLQKRGEISGEYADKLRKQIKEKGIRSFGPKKEVQYYLKQAGFC